MVGNFKVFNGALFCDRDGVLIEELRRNNNPTAIDSISQIQFCPGVESAVEKLRNRLPIFMVTNQPEIARGSISSETVDEINATISDHLGLTAVYVCPHDDFDECLCRKPKPGLLLEAAREFKLDLKESFMVGDRWKDVACAQASGVEAFFINKNYAERQPEPPYETVLDLEEVADKILKRVS